MAYKDILYDIEDGIARVTLNIPEKMNRLSIETMKEIVAALKEAKDDEAVRVIIIQGAGNAFCAGADLGDFMGRSTMEVRKVFDAFADLSRVFIDLGKPSIAAVHGIALAGGCGLAIYPDITVASEKAKFGLPEINVGLWPCMVSAALPRILGAKKAIELMLTGDIIDAEEAERIGLINRVVPQDKLEETVMALARKLCKKSSLVMSAGRRSFYTMLGMEYNEAMIYLLDVLALIMSTEDSKEGLTAFLEKRKPVWKNR